MSETEAAQQQAELDALEYTVSQEALENVGAGSQPAAEVMPETAEIVQQLLSMGFGVLAPGWGVTEPEIEQLAKAYGPLIDKYFPDGLGDHGLEINAILITSAVILPRIRMPRKVEEKPEQQQEGGKSAEKTE